MKIPTPEELAAWRENFEAWIQEQQIRTGSNVMGRAAATMERLRLENTHLTGTVGELKADLDRANATIASLCELNTRLAQENETLAPQVPDCQGSTPERQILNQEKAITDLRDLLTSAHAIATRGGEDTNWEAFIKQLKERGIGSITAKVFRKPKDYAVTGHRTTSGQVAELPQMVPLGDLFKITQVVGQAWCRTETPPDGAILGFTEGMVLCTTHQDVVTGELTYVPISFDDLPWVTETPAR